MIAEYLENICNDSNAGGPTRHPRIRGELHPTRDWRGWDVAKHFLLVEKNLFATTNVLRRIHRDRKARCIESSGNGKV